MTLGWLTSEYFKVLLSIENIWVTSYARSKYFIYEYLWGHVNWTEYTSSDKNSNWRWLLDENLKSTPSRLPWAHQHLKAGVCSPLNMLLLTYRAPNVSAFKGSEVIKSRQRYDWMQVCSYESREQNGCNNWLKLILTPNLFLKHSQWIFQNNADLNFL